MIEEYMNINDKSFTISLNANEINEIREKNIQRNSIQIFKDGRIFSANSVGGETTDELKQRAIENQVGSIGFDHEYSANKKITTSSGKEMATSEVMELTKEFTNRVKEELPQFLFSGKIESNRTTKNIKNTMGGEYQSTTNQVGGFLVLKQKGSPNIMDSILPFEGRNGNLDTPHFQEFIRMHQSFDNVVEVEKGKYPVVFLMNETFYGKFSESCHPDIYHQNAGLYSGKLGQKIFNEKINFMDVRHSEDFNTFHKFDDEGMSLENKLPIIENGVFKNIYYDKKTAKKYNTESTGNGRREFNNNVSAKPYSMRFEPTGEELTDIYKNYEKVIIAVLAGGGDITSSGSFSSPLQVGFLVENGKILGRTNQISLTNHVDKMMGDDFIGVLNENIVPVSIKPYVTFMEVF